MTKKTKFFFYYNFVANIILKQIVSFFCQIDSHLKYNHVNHQCFGSKYVTAFPIHEIFSVAVIQANQQKQWSPWPNFKVKGHLTSYLI
jgi:hypothetical protein